ncbi:hypothetical protein AN963_06160 [Brevibacillus choshinensis]|uniref:Uncharacterized protein n=1 Tax=Brevibacillus choshinensis TaxID=54911 RepID=A0ABR5NCS1_BRECH|nr:hypothetical protein [Brevibacillus choshinensis]KQL49342.1 hypothetical protein AN963_06160 [Brevibacillus choshinensis]
MEKKKKWDLPHWVMPGVFSGNYVVDEAVERISIVKPTEKELEPANGYSAETIIETAVEQASPPLPEQPIEIILTHKESVIHDQVEKLDLEITSLKEQLTSWEKRFRELEETQTKEIQYLYQVVLALKKEWENERNEDSHH